MANSSFIFSNKRYLLDKKFYQGAWQYYRKIVVLKLIGSNKKVLDAGCFDGQYMQEIKKNNNQVFGIEASEVAVESAKKNGLDVVGGDLEKRLPFDDDSFDVVYSGEVIEHIVDTDFFVDEIRRILKNKGVLIITTPNLASFSKRLLLLAGRNPYQEASFSYPKNAVGHLREYTFDLLRDFMEFKGFEVKKVKSDVVGVPFVPVIIQRFLAIIFPKLGRSLIVELKKK